ncbi:hypothetical protein DCC85_11930 [Paenibacillus sp. CAA11]|uniref:hypothetical protein n=1 Tax=Paenibacillus sp. CAA11 TaxID=1532905 RepID=UPI000D3B6473|nr:hypothetical protein [Paenibacillus sp. CAA11]AWB44857.1 hypothetical protein DCC85_11930 [Paenibacillus sp. CAA11]
MGLKEVLFLILAVAIAGLIAAALLIKRQQRLVRTKAIFISEQQSLKGKLQGYLQKSYLLFMQIPPLRTYVKHVRKAISHISLQNEYELRLHVTGMVYLLLGGYGSVIALLLLLNPDWFYFLVLVLTAVIMDQVVLGSCINRLQRHLLRQTSELLSLTRHAYQRHGIVEEAVLEAAEEAEDQISRHAYTIAEALSAERTQAALEQYYETQPGRYLKSYAGLCYLIMEYGDRPAEGKSVFLHALSGLKQEIYLDLLRLSRLDYLLKGLTVIALAPLFFTKPVEVWARNNFPLMNDFYLSKAGMLIKILIYLIIFIAYLLLKRMRSEDDSGYQATGRRGEWIQRMYNVSWIRRVVSKLMPARGSSSYIRSEALIRDTDTPWKVEWLYLRRFLYFIIGFAAAMVIAVLLHLLAKDRIVTTEPTNILFGTMTKEDQARAEEQARLDQRAMRQIQGTGSLDRNELKHYYDAEGLNHPSEEELEVWAERLEFKFKRYQSEYVKWWEVLVAFLAGFCGYYAPLWMLYFYRRVRTMDMKHEVYQFYAMIGILKEIERISAEEILEWLHSYSIMFRTPIQKCLLNYEYNPLQAIEELKEDVGLVEFKLLTDKLMLAVDKLPVRKAFDDLDQEMGYYFEQRKLEYEKLLDRKANLGRMIGFTPMYALVFLYLVIPLLWMSFNQMGVYYEQIQHIS